MHSGGIDNTVVVYIPVYNNVVYIALVWFAVVVVLDWADMGNQHLVPSPCADGLSSCTCILLVINIIKNVTIISITTTNITIIIILLLMVRLVVT